MTRARHPIALHHALAKLWTPPPGWRGWSAVNHTSVGKRFMLAALVFFVIGGVLAMMIRAQLGSSQSAFMDADQYAQVFTMHGTVMMFLFAIPMLEGFGFYLLPKMLGARDMAFPRLGAYSWWCYLFGGTILIVAMVLGLAPDTGWFMYTPLSSKQFAPGINNDMWLIGVTFAEISALCGAVELITTILKMRAPGMSLDRMPILAWYLLVMAGMILVGFPPLILGSILLELERAFGLPFYTVSLGGDNLLWQHLFWLFGHPEVYIIFLPAAGLVSTMLPTFAQRPLVGYVWVVNSAIIMGFLSFGLWVHHMFTVGIPHLSLSFFSAASMLIAIPTGIQFFAWIATLWSGKVVLRLPMLYMAGFFVIFLIGGLTGVMVALVPFNFQIHDTHFVVAHFHYVLVGGMVFPILAATYYWMPLIWGRTPSGPLGTTAFWLIFAGFNLTFFPMHLTGLLGMTRRTYTYSPELGWDALNLASSIGGFLQAIGFAVFLLDVILHVRLGRGAPRNPWGAGTLEWAIATPPAPYNFSSIASVESREPLWENPSLPAEMAAGKHWLSNLEQRGRQTLGVDVLTGKPTMVIFVPTPAWLPLYSGLATGGFFVCVLLKWYAVSLLFAALTVALFLCWAWTRAPREPHPPVEAYPGVQLPHHTQCRGAPGWWGTMCAIAGDATLVASLVFGCIYLRLFAPNWPPPQLLNLSWTWVMFLVACLAVMGASAAWARSVGARGKTSATRTPVAVSGAASLAGLLGIAILIIQAPPATGHAYAAAVLVTLVYAALHLFIVLLMAGFIFCRSHLNNARAPLLLDTSILAAWGLYSALAVVLLLGGLLFIGARP